MIFVIMKKELKSYFRSPSMYALTGLFALLVGWFFFAHIVDYVENVQNLPPEMQGHFGFMNAVVLKLLGNINFVLLFFSPILTMRSFSEEKKMHTMDLYYASPVSDWQIVLGKYFALCVFGVFLISTTFVFPVLLKMIHFSDFNIVAMGYLSITLSLCCYLAVGMFASSLTDGQVMAALLAFVMLLFCWMFYWASELASNYFLQEILRYLSVIGHFQNLAQGTLSISDLFYYLSFIFMFVFFTQKSIESRSW